MDNFETISFDFSSMRVCGLRANRGAKHKVLAVHGWLDNANSFVPLMPFLDNVDIVAIDLPGHGHSSHLTNESLYHFSDMPYWFFKIAEQLNWEDFHYMGHSLGGCLAPFVAVANPDPIQSIIMLEASGPLSEAADALPDRIRRSYLDRVKGENNKRKIFATVEDGIEARLLATKMNRQSARLIVERQMNQIDNGFIWRFDPKHRQASPIYMVEKQIMSVLERVSVPTAVIISNDGYIISRQDHIKRLQMLEPKLLEYVPGYHHMHMDDPKPSASIINRFLNTFTS